MWLDRFSSQSTPTGSSTPNRAFSPAPQRKSSSLAPHTNGISLAATRSNSSLNLSISPGSSDASLPLPTKGLARSSLRHEQKAPANVPDSLDVLHRVLGTPAYDDTSTNNPIQSQDDVEIDFRGLSLQEYAAQEHTSSAPVATDPATTKEVNATRENYKEFHSSVKECDDVLESVQLYLTNFKAELGQVSAEIESLQARSFRLNAQLDNRRKVEKLLGPAVESLSIAPATIRSIADGPIDDIFGKALTEIEARRLAIGGKSQESEPSKALEDMRPLLDDLKDRAIERIRDYLVAQIKALRSPNINAQIIQQQTFLRHRELYPFLSRNHPVLAEEIAQAYANTMKWYFASHFTRYRGALEKLQLYVFDQADLLGSDPTTKRIPVAGGKGIQMQPDAFSIGRRADILKSKNATAIPSHVVEDSKDHHHLEVPFRSFNQTLLDNACAEYATATDLFSTNSYQQVSRRVTEILSSSFTLGHELTKRLVDTTTDCLGILICVRLNQYFAFESQRRKVPVLDGYTNYTNILLWPRFQKIMDLHCESLKRVPTSTNRGAAAAFNLVGGSDTAKASVAPHAITQRFGQFLHGILVLSAESGDDEPVANSLARLRSEYETLVGKLSKGAGDAQKRSRFLYNNYSLVLTIIGDTHGKLAEEQKEHFSSVVKDLKPR